MHRTMLDNTQVMTVHSHWSGSLHYEVRCVWKFTSHSLPHQTQIRWWEWQTLAGKRVGRWCVG